jgi:hypothetical protein
MADYTKTAISDVIGILWKELKDNGALVDTDYPIVSDPDEQIVRRLIPIFPTQEDETKNLISNPEAPYLVYDFDTMSYDVEWVICKERLTFKIYAPGFDKVIEIMNIMLDLFRRFDESAANVNTYVKSVNPTSPFRYKYFSLTEANSPDPADELAGRLEADISIVYAYTRNLNTEGRFA